MKLKKILLTLLSVFLILSCAKKAPLVYNKDLLEEEINKGQAIVLLEVAYDKLGQIQFEIQEQVTGDSYVLDLTPNRGRNVDIIDGIKHLIQEEPQEVKWTTHIYSLPPGQYEATYFRKKINKSNDARPLESNIIELKAKETTYIGSYKITYESGLGNTYIIENHSRIESLLKQPMKVQVGELF